MLQLKTGRYANAKEKYVATTIVLSKQIAFAVDPTKQEQLHPSTSCWAWAAEGKLNGKATDFSSLENTSREELKFQEKNAKFIHAGNEKRSLPSSLQWCTTIQIQEQAKM